MTNRVIWKYDLAVQDVAIIEMPLGAEVLCVQVQHNNPRIWALVDPTTTHREKKGFRVVGTGHEMDFSRVGRHIGTFQLHEGELVFHVFEA